MQRAKNCRFLPLANLSPKLDIHLFAHRRNGRSGYSLSILSAHSINATKSGGVTKRAFFPSRSASRTARAR